MQTDYYARLNIGRNASIEDIKKAYRNLSKDHHPDVNQGNDEIFKLLLEAYETLSDPEKRRLYDTGVSSEVLQIVESEFLQVVKAISERNPMAYLTLDLTEAAIQSLSRKRDKAQEIIGLNEAIITQFRSMQERLSGPSFLGKVLQREMNSCISVNKENSALVVTIGKAIAHLQEYTYTVDPPIVYPEVRVFTGKPGGWSKFYTGGDGA